MFKRKITIVACLLGLVSLTGCAVNRSSASLSPGADLHKVVSAYVVKLPADVHHVDDIIKTKLEKQGYLVTQGPELKGPYNADIAVTYVDKWMWDITMYMIELTVTVRDPNTGFPMAVGNSFHTSLSRKSPDEMVDEVVDNILKAPATALK